MVTVAYDYEREYAYDEGGGRFPRLIFSVTNPAIPSRSVDVDAYLDSGAQRSLFAGWIGQDLKLDILSGRRMTYRSTLGNGLTATLHVVRLEHEDLGEFELEVGFSLDTITRNLLGRDFFNLVQVGFRERHLKFFIAPRP